MPQNFTVECRTFLTIHPDARAETDPCLLALAYVVSILEGINPTLGEFEDSGKKAKFKEYRFKAM